MRESRQSQPGGRRWLLLVVAMLAGTLSAQAQLPMRTDTVFGLRLPPQIGGAKREAVWDYESARPGLGYGVTYKLPGWTTDVYFYDLKQSSIPDDATSTAVKDALEQAKKEVFGLGQRGDYKNVTLKSDYTIIDAGGRTRFECAMLTYYHTLLKGEADAYLCLTSWKGRFVKFRMTTPRNDTSAAVSRRFIEAWSTVLWPQS